SMKTGSAFPCREAPFSGIHQSKRSLRSKLQVSEPFSGIRPLKCSLRLKAQDNEPLFGIRQGKNVPCG
ncbi:MAG: hypothetical protein Q4D81_08475, partial [Eubacteriales bacterium]|nr:hypothetical protein [Eubacteriales bacterium]